MNNHDPQHVQPIRLTLRFAIGMHTAGLEKLTKLVDLYLVNIKLGELGECMAPGLGLISSLASLCSCAQLVAPSPDRNTIDSIINLMSVLLDNRPWAEATRELAPAGTWVQPLTERSKLGYSREPARTVAGSQQAGRGAC